jgi:dipeptidyl aminopeptidase/acylaminoacyl peptidase
VADVDAGTFREVTRGPNSDRLPAWSPDGRTLAFLSDRAAPGKHQLYLLHEGGLAEAIPGPTVDGTVESLSWSPDGRSILLAYAESGAELAGAQGSGSSAAAQEDVPGWIPEVRGAEDEGWRRLAVVDVTANDVKPASRDGLNVWEAVWCGSNQIAAVASESPGESSWYDAPLVMIDPESGKERILYRSDVQVGYPAASPSGNRLAVVEALCSDRWIVAGTILMIDPETGDAAPVDAKGTDVTYLAWRDEDHLAYVGMRDLDTVFGDVAGATGTATEAFATDETSGLFQPAFQPVGDDGYAVVLESFDRYPEVVVVSKGEVRTVASLAHDGSRALRDMAGHMDTVSWTAPDGLEIHGFVVLPDGDGPHPLVVNVHGGPVSATGNRFAMRSPLVMLLVGRGYAVFLPNPRGSAGRGRGFARMVYGDMGGADAQDILSGVDALVERGVADPDRVGVMGGSYGGFMSAWLVTQSDRFAASVALSPVTDWYSQHHTSNIGHWDQLILEDTPGNPGGEYFRRSPVLFADRATTPTLVTAGLEDRCTPPGQAIEFHQALVNHGVESELVLYPGEGHGVRNYPAILDLGARILGWFDRHMGPERSA